MIYLDYASNTPVHPQVIKTFYETEMQFFGNPNAAHQAGRAAAKKMEETTEAIARLLGVKYSEIIYTSGASESNNLALKGLARSYRHSGKHIISTCLEHSSVSGTLTALQEQGYEISFADILPDGTVDKAHIKELLRDDTIILSVGYTDGELGTVQPIAEIAEILRYYPNCRFHVDATQAVGKISVNFQGIDCMVFAPHKFYGLNGCGVLVKKENVMIAPLIHGGKSTTIYRSGTPALSLAVSIHEALKLALDDLESHYQTIEKLKSSLIHQLQKYPLVRINSSDKSIPHILNISVKGIKGEAFQNLLNEQGVCVSAKSACSTPNTPSRPVLAVSKDKKNALSAWRISLSHLTSDTEIERFIQIFDQCYKELTK